MLSVDLGFGYTKAFAGTRKVMLPSVIAPGQKDDGGMNMFKSLGHLLEVKKPGEVNRISVLAGERAAKEGRAVQFSLDNEKFSKQASIMLALTAVYLAGKEGQVRLGLGLPISTYMNKEYRDEVVQAFNKINYHVRVDSGPERYISFIKTALFPQGIGAMYAMQSLPDEGLVGLLDIGFFTTDIVLVEIEQGNIVPLKKHFRSIKLGVSRAVQLFTDQFMEITGEPLSLVEALNVWNKGKITYRGRIMDIKPIIEQSRKYAGEAISSAVNEAWVEKINRLDYVYLSGGGALELGDNIKEMLPQAVSIDDPQFANAVGFYKMLETSINKKTA
jgi:plasmid segregation protein ParM